MRHSDYFMMKQLEVLNEHGYELTIDLVSVKPQRFLCEMWKKGAKEVEWTGGGRTKPQALADALAQCVITTAS